MTSLSSTSSCLTSRSTNAAVSSGRVCRLQLTTFLLFIATLSAILSTYSVATAAQPMVYTEAIRTEVVNLEKSLWNYLAKPNFNNIPSAKANQLKKVFDSHRKIINDYMNIKFRPENYTVLNHYDWSLLERDLLQIDGIFGYVKDYLNKLQSSEDLDERAVLDICEAVLRNDKSFSLARIFHDIELIMVKQALYYRAHVDSTEQICHTQQSPQQFVYSLYADIALTELKGYTMMEFSWLMLRVYGKGNYSQEAELMRQDYEKRTNRTLRLLREVMIRSDRISWRCDPEKHILGKTYDVVTRLLQGYVENEVNLNNDDTCTLTCSEYSTAKIETCFDKEKIFCKQQPRCSGKLYDCNFVDSDMWICQSSGVNNSRRYEYIEYENGVLYGKKNTGCRRGITKVDSWWRWLFWHCSYCFCLCDEKSGRSDRFFNLRETSADALNNKIVTGLRFVKNKRIFHLQIQEGELLPRGIVNSSSLTWRPVDDYSISDSNVRDKVDFHTLTYESRSIDLDDIHTDDISYVVTGVRFRVVGVHLNLEAKFTEFDFTTGKLIEPEKTSVWKSNDNTDVSGERRQKIFLQDPDIPTRTIVKSIPDSKHNQYLDFTHSSFRKDAAQSTVPYIDIQEVVANPPIPLSGIGIYHKGRTGYGGFLAPKIITYDFSTHVQLPKSNN